MVAWCGCCGGVVKWFCGGVDVVVEMLFMFFFDRLGNEKLLNRQRLTRDIFRSHATNQSETLGKVVKTMALVNRRGHNSVPAIRGIFLYAFFTNSRLRGAIYHMKYTLFRA